MFFGLIFFCSIIKLICIVGISLYFFYAVLLTVLIYYSLFCFVIFLKCYHLFRLLGLLMCWVFVQMLMALRFKNERVYHIGEVHLLISSKHKVQQGMMGISIDLHVEVQTPVLNK